MKLVVLTLSIVISLLILEGGLRLLTPYPVTFGSNKQDHDRLGYVLSSDLPDIDETGFRNRSRTLADADLVVVGDSHVYSTGVVLGQDFPSRLAARTQRNVYNMGVGSYGVYHYAVLLEDLTRSAVRDVVLGLYPANDLVGTCSIVALDSWGPFANTHGLAARSFQATLPPQKQLTGSYVSFCNSEAGATDEPKSWGTRVRNWLRKHVAFLNVLHHKLAPYRDSNAKQLILPAENRVRWKRAQKHARSTTLEDDRRRIVFEDSQSIFENAHRQLHAAGIGFHILLIPSKELVFHDWAVANDWPMDAPFRDALAPQKQLMDRYVSFFQSRGIPFRDATGALIAALDEAIADGRTLYHVADDGHPHAEGYDVYAKAAAELLAGPGS